VKRIFSPISLLQTLIALLLIIGCLYAAQWQFGRGQSQANTNRIISTNSQLPALEERALLNLDPVGNQWREIKISGTFAPEHQELVRNRYFEGKFGFEVLTLFKSSSGKNFWIDRGWVPAGPNAMTPPVVELPPLGDIQVLTRIRSENLSRQLQGSFFVTRNLAPKPNSIAKLQGIEAAPYYLDLLPSADGSVKPLTEIQLPELTNGPHFAYALQWMAFAMLALIGRILLFRETERLPLV